MEVFALNAPCRGCSVTIPLCRIPPIDAEGPRTLTNIFECDLDALTIGQMVEVVFMPTTDPDGPPVAMFRPVSGQASAA